MADLAHASENDNDLIGDTDAVHWAERFVHHVGVKPSIATDEGAMLSWFATCMVSTEDATVRRLQEGLARRPRILPVYEAVGAAELSEAVHQALGAASVCWDPMNSTGVFESERAAQIGGELIGIIGQFADAAKDK